MIFWKDSIDFNRVIKQQQDQIKNTKDAISPEKRRAANYRMLAEEAIRKLEQEAQHDYRSSSPRKEIGILYL